MARKTRNSPEDTSILPLDIIQAILARLPVKSLLRFKTVSKSWNTITSDPQFRQSKNLCSHHDVLFLTCKLTSGSVSTFSEMFYVIKLENQKFVIASELGNPFGVSAEPLYSCNGIVLLKIPRDNGYEVYRYELWNPSIRKHTRIWCPYKLRGYNHCHGLYHDPTVNDYKVAIMGVEFYAVFSCKNRTWAKKNYSPPTKNISDGIFFDGAVYWLFFNEREIQYFDLRDDKLKKLQLPNYLKAKHTSNNLTVLSRRLCLYGLNNEETKLQVWAMENHGDDQTSWMELMNMENLQAHRNIESIEAH